MAEIIPIQRRDAKAQMATLLANVKRAQSLTMATHASLYDMPGHELQPFALKSVNEATHALQRAIRELEAIVEDTP